MAVPRLVVAMAIPVGVFVLIPCLKTFFYC